MDAKMWAFGGYGSRNSLLEFPDVVNLIHDFSPSSSGDDKQVLNLNDSDSDDLDESWCPSSYNYSHTASSIVRWAGESGVTI